MECDRCNTLDDVLVKVIFEGKTRHICRLCKVALTEWWYKK